MLKFSLFCMPQIYSFLIIIRESWQKYGSTHASKKINDSHPITKDITLLRDISSSSIFMKYFYGWTPSPILSFLIYFFLEICRHKLFFLFNCLFTSTCPVLQLKRAHIANERRKISPIFLHIQVNLILFQSTGNISCWCCSFKVLNSHNIFYFQSTFMSNFIAYVAQ